MLTDEDLDGLYLLVTSLARYREAERHLLAEVDVVLSGQGTAVKNPYLTVQRLAWDIARPLLSEFGLTPTARGRLKVAGDAPVKDDLLD